MSLIKANAVQIGQSGTATQNFTLAVPSSPDGTIKLARGNSGATTQDVISVDASGNVSFAGTTGLGNISNSTAIATGSTTVRSLANRFADVVNVKDFGADPTGVVDSSVAFQNAIDSLLNGGIVEFDGKYLIDNTITIKYNVSLVGKNKSIDQINGKIDPSKISCQLIVNPTQTIYLESAALISDCLILKKGLTLPFTSKAAAATGVASYAGTALTVQGASAGNLRVYGPTFERLMIVGFEQAIYCNHIERCVIDLVHGDCTNGITIETSADICYISNCHFWPYTTAHQGFDVSSAYRSGKAYYITNKVDWAKLTNCFSYGYDTGFHIESVNDVQLIGCSADWIAPIKQNGTNYLSRGFWITGSAQQIKLIGCQSAGQYYGVDINVSSTETVTLAGHSCWGNDKYHVFVEQGNAMINGCMFTDFPTATQQIIASSKSGTTATLSVFSSSPYQVGSLITISGASNTEWNGTYTVTAVPDDITIQFVVPITHSSTAGTGALISDPTIVDTAVQIQQVSGNPSNAIITNSTFESINNNTIVFNTTNQNDVAYFNKFINCANPQYKNANLKVTRTGINPSPEGGNVRLSRAYDDVAAYRIDAYGYDPASAGYFRVVDEIASVTRFSIDGNGIVYTPGAYGSTTADPSNVVVTSTGALRRSTSSIKYKTEVEDVEKQYSYNLLKCRPVWFRSTSESDNQNWSHWGFIAEEVAEIDPRLVQWRTSDISYGKDGELIETPLQEPVAEGVSYDRFVPHLLNVISDLDKRVKELESK